MYGKDSSHIYYGNDSASHHYYYYQCTKSACLYSVLIITTTTTSSAKPKPKPKPSLNNKRLLLHVHDGLLDAEQVASVLGRRRVIGVGLVLAQLMYLAKAVLDDTTNVLLLGVFVGDVNVLSNPLVFADPLRLARTLVLKLLGLRGELIDGALLVGLHARLSRQSLAEKFVIAVLAINLLVLELYEHLLSLGSVAHAGVEGDTKHIVDVEGGELLLRVARTGVDIHNIGCAFALDERKLGVGHVLDKYLLDSIRIAVVGAENRFVVVAESH